MHGDFRHGHGAFRGLLGALIIASLGACRGETMSSPGYKPAPPLWAGHHQPVKTAPLSGLVYVAESPKIVAETQLPEGYRRMSGEEGRITVRVPGTPPQTRVVPIVDGAYLMEGLPIGLELEVSAGSPGFASRRQVVTIVLPAGRRVNFAHDPDGAGSYLIPLRDVPR